MHMVVRHRRLLQLLLLQRVAAMRAPHAPSLAANRRAALRGAAAVLATATLPASAAPPPVPGAFDYFSQCASVPRALVINSVDVDATVAFFSKALGMDCVARSPDGSAPASRGRDDVREVWGGKPMSNRHRHAW